MGGSGGLSGTLARMALKQGNEVWTVTRGKRSLPEGVHPITVDRNEEEAFAKALNDCQIDGIRFTIRTTRRFRRMKMERLMSMILLTRA